MNDPRLILFPFMHPELASIEVPDGVYLLDPGLAPKEDPRYWRPTGLPMDGRTLERFRDEALNFGLQVRRPADMAYFAARGEENFFSGSSLHLRSELAELDRGRESKSIDPVQVAQAEAALAFFLELDHVQLRAADKDIGTGWDRIESALGLDEEDAGEVRRPDLSVTETFLPPWERLLPVYARLISDGTVLYCPSAEVLAGMKELGATFALVDRDMARSLGLPKGMGEALRADLDREALLAARIVNKASGGLTVCFQGFDARETRSEDE
ncbi:MAG: hypothetical protein EOM25_06640 [Deltaproteobacteria bacterium]|nr:hypothetical protein [Deltaproteobacteria bacterium]